ncbi:MAG: hypothetical protein Rhims3KO_35890 [Hyphomicrobiales bacterium]
MGRAGADNETGQETWHEALLTVAGLKAGVSGLEDATAAEIGEFFA